MNDVEYTKWVACWGNAPSISDRELVTYAKDLTLRYPVKMCFDGNRLRFHFSNITGEEAITITEVTIGISIDDRSVDECSIKSILFDGEKSVTIAPGSQVVSDELIYEVNRGDELSVSIYLGDYTQMNSGVLVTGPLSKGFFAYGNYVNSERLPLEKTRSTNWFYFLDTIDVLTSEDNHALICYGDSITAQDWPDYLILRTFEEKMNNVSIIRRAISGTRILREYDCITYAAYGAKGEKRFDRECDVAGADAVIIQHGINDIIHPVGEDVNVFRPMSDMPTLEEMIDGVSEIYVKNAREKGLKVYSGTLLPIKGWRTYAEFRDVIRGEFNEWLRTSDIFDGCIDFDKAVRDGADPLCFAEGFDSGDHLHPSSAAYKAMAEAVPPEILG